MFKKIYHRIKADFVNLNEEKTKRLILVQSYKDSAFFSKESLIDSKENKLKNQAELIVSLTTFGERIKSVYITLESISRQTLKPHRIILWLAEDEFTMDTLPISIKKMQKRGLEIRFCKDVRSYKKLIYTVRDFPNADIITIDDDIIYDSLMIEELNIARLKYPNTICCHRSHVIKKDANDNYLPYNQWGQSKEILEPSLLHLPTGVGGVFYFAGCFDDELVDEEKFMKVAPTNDDFWFKAMTWKNNIKVYNPNVYSRENPVFITLDSSKIEHLAAENVIKGRNNEYMQNIVTEYNLKLE
jgi:hypothetical protein